MTAGMKRALKAVDGGKVTLSAAGNLIYSTRDVNPQSLKACRRRDWIVPDVHRDRIILTDRGRLAMLRLGSS